MLILLSLTFHSSTLTKWPKKNLHWRDITLGGEISLFSLKLTNFMQMAVWPKCVVKIVTVLWWIFSLIKQYLLVLFIFNRPCLNLNHMTYIRHLRFIVSKMKILTTITKKDIKWSLYSFFHLVINLNFEQ